MRTTTFLLLCLFGGLCLCDDDALLETTDIAIVGAGWGGSYSAWRLASALNPNQNKIRMYEKLDRIGGRAFFVDQTYAPELNGLEENMGSYRFNEKEHVLINALVKTVFNIPTRCASITNYVNQTTDCPLDQGPQHVFARGVYLSPTAQGNSANWPYNLGTTSWTTLANKPSPARQAVGIAFPYLNVATYPDLQSCNDTLRWQTVNTVTQRIINCATDPACAVPGKNPNALPLKYFVQNLYTEDFFALNDINPGSSYLARGQLMASVYAQGVGTAIGFGLTGCGGAAPMQQVQEGGGRKGYATAAHLMVAKAAQLQGVAQSTFLKFNHQMFSIRKLPLLNRYSLKFTNGKTVVAKKVILNMGFYSLTRQLDKHDNILFDDASANLKAVFSLSELTSTKLYLHYNKAWWIKAGLLKGSVSTDEILRLAIFHGGHVLCPTPQANPDLCRGLMFASYQILHVHELKGADWQTEGPDASSNLYVLRRTSTRDSSILDTFHSTLMKVVAPLVNFTASIEPPTFGLLANWAEDPWNKCGAYAGPNQITPGTQEATALRPLPAEDIFLANIDWMTTFNGFAEASLVMAERIAHRYFNLPRPSWLPQAWYDFVIHTANH